MQVLYKAFKIFIFMDYIILKFRQTRISILDQFKVINKSYLPFLADEQTFFQLYFAFLPVPCLCCGNQDG